MSRAARRRIRTLTARMGDTDGPSLHAAAGRMTPCQRARAAHHLLSLLPPDKRREVARRHLPEPVADVLSARLDPCYERDAVRLRLLRRDVP